MFILKILRIEGKYKMLIFSYVKWLLFTDSQRLEFLNLFAL